MRKHDFGPPFSTIEFSPMNTPDSPAFQNITEPAFEPSFEIVGPRETKMLKFIEAYLDRGNASDAARQLGYDGGCAANIGWRLLHDPFVQERLRTYFEKYSEDRAVARREIMAGLYREANDFTRGANSLTRIRAWETLAKLTGLDLEEVRQEESELALTSEEVRLIKEEFDINY